MDNIDNIQMLEECPKTLRADWLQLAVQKYTE
jgi:hypothetical protein